LTRDHVARDERIRLDGGSQHPSCSDNRPLLAARRL